MKKLIFLLPLTFLAMVGFRNLTEPLPIGAALPDPGLQMKDITGKLVTFKDVMKNNGLLVMFSCNTCPVVGKYQSRTLEIAKYAMSKGVGVIVLNSNEATRSDGESFEDMQAYGKEQGYDFHYVLDADSRMADAFGATRTPEVFLFDKNEKLTYHGAIDDNANDPAEVTRKHASLAIDETIAGKFVSTAKTRFVGCGIKRL